MRTVIVDTSAIYALVDEDDRNHKAAVAFLKQEGEELLMLITNMILFESLTLINTRLGKKKAVHTLNAVQASGRYRLIHLSAEDHEDTWRMFKGYSDKEWSPFDCSCLAVARRYSIDEAFAFDRHFEQMAGMGLMTIP